MGASYILQNGGIVRSLMKTWVSVTNRILQPSESLRQDARETINWFPVHLFKGKHMQQQSPCPYVPEIYRQIDGYDREGKFIDQALGWTTGVTLKPVQVQLVGTKRRKNCL
jgi:hypothetical protein